jgi:hypothetical protein
MTATTRDYTFAQAVRRVVCRDKSVPWPRYVSYLIQGIPPCR